MEKSQKIPLRFTEAACKKREHDPAARYHEWEVYRVDAEYVDALLAIDGSDRASATGKDGALVNIARNSPAWNACEHE